MKSENASIWCEECGKKWEMDEYGQLHCINGEDIFNHVPDWYYWERENVREAVMNGTYRFEDEVRVERLHSKGEKYRNIGQLKLTHDENGFTLSGMTNEGELYLNRPVNSMYSCHIEYNFQKRGDAVELCNLEDTYFLYPQNHDNIVTKLHFATEELFKKDKLTRKEPPRKRRSESKEIEK